MANATANAIDIATPEAQDGDMPQRTQEPSVQTRVRPATYRLAVKAATREGLSLSAWLRRMVTLECERLVEAGKISPEE
jgi:predicted HicB family RNase H-like nuclease